MIKLGSKGTYAGIGSRNISSEISRVKMEFAYCMTIMGLKLYSGGADGSDTSYEVGAKAAYDELSKLHPEHYNSGEYQHAMTIFLPWSGFNGRCSGNGYTSVIHSGAEKLTRSYHKGWDYLSQGAKKMMERNSMQVLSDTLNSPVRFVSAFTSDGVKTGAETSSKTGGTGQAIRIASDYGVPVYNMGNSKDLDKAKEWIEKTVFDIFKKHHINVRESIDNYIDLKIEVEKKVDGNLISMALNGDFDVIIHGSNCMNTMGSGIALEIKNNFPSAYDADQKTKKGDSKKLGTYTSSLITLESGKKLTVVNAYIQYKYGREGYLYSDYNAIRKVMKKINKDFKGSSIGIPRIGAGLANGCWATISGIIKSELSDAKVTLVNFNNEKELFLDIDKGITQSSFGF